MTQQQIVSRDQLISGLRASEQQLVDALASIDAANLETGCYENGWNARQVLAHVASIEWTYAKVLDLAKSGETDDAVAAGGPPPQSSTSYNAPASGPILSYNDRQVEKRASMSVTELLDEFRQNRARTLAAIESADDGLLATPVQSAGGIKGPASNVLQALAVGHVMLHLTDILNSVKQP